MGSFFLPNWSPPDDPARPLPAEGRPWPSDYNDDVDDKDNNDDNDERMSITKVGGKAIRWSQFVTWRAF